PSDTFTVTYDDADWIRASTIDSSDVRVTGPGGFERTAKLVAVDAPGDGLVRVARYKIAAPEGGWTPSADQRYTIVLRSAQVRDDLGQPSHAGILGQFRVAAADGATSSPSTSTI